MRGEVLAGVERRRRWTARQKLQVVRASWEPGARVADVARRFDVTRQQTYDWRAAARRGEFAGVEAPATFIEVIPAPAESGAAAAEPPEAAPATEATIEIGVSGGRCLRVPASLPTTDLRRLIRAAEGA